MVKERRVRVDEGRSNKRCERSLLRVAGRSRVGLVREMAGGKKVEEVGKEVLAG